MRNVIWQQVYLIQAVRALRNEMTKKFLELENSGVGFEELERLAVGGLRKAVVDGDVKTGSVMAGQSAGMVKEKMSCQALIQKLVKETGDRIKEKYHEAFGHQSD